MIYKGSVIVGSVALLLGFAIWQIYAPESMEYWAREDAPVESSTAVFYGAAAIVFCILAWRVSFPRVYRPRLGRVFLIVGALGCFIVMGEEISWGQRIFGFETPESIKALNYQDEFTFHNLQFMYDMFTSSETGIFHANAFSLLMVIIGVLFPIAAVTGWGRQLIRRFAFPVVPGCYSVLFLGALFYGKYMQGYAVDPDTPPEIREFMWSLGFFLFAVHGLLWPHDLYRIRPSEPEGHKEDAGRFGG